MVGFTALLFFVGDHAAPLPQRHSGSPSLDLGANAL
jgi:hypothetical protein